VGVVRIAKPDEPRINEEIRAPQCRLIGVDGSQLGFFSIKDAQRVADDQGLDLVEIAPNANPPVCRVMNYGKYKYEQAIKAKAARKNQAKVDIKEMKFRPKIDVGDYTTKKKHIERFLAQGSKVKITIMFRGREIAHPELGLNMLEKLAADLKDVATVEAPPKLEGRNMHMLVAPVRDNAKAAKSAKADTEAEADSNEE
jgi:translation initiation factor IF-3